jgi:hypothetical protein
MRRRLHPPTWKEAIETVLYTLLCVARSEPPISDEQDRILTDVYLLCDDLRTRRHRHTEKTNLELSAKYGISPRTVRNWRKAGCPFAKGQARVLCWMVRRRYVPAGAKAKFGKELQRRRFNVKFKAIFTDNFAAMRANILTLKAHFRAQGLPVPDWTRGMFRAR